MGAGNAVVIVDEDADIADAAHKIMLSKTFDFATSCSSDNSIIVLDSIYDKTIAALKAEGGYLCNEEEKKKLQDTMFPDGHHLNTKLTAQAPEVIAAEAGINLPAGSKFLRLKKTASDRSILSPMKSSPSSSRYSRRRPLTKRSTL